IPGKAPAPLDPVELASAPPKAPGASSRGLREPDPQHVVYVAMPRSRTPTLEPVSLRPTRCSDLPTAAHDHLTLRNPHRRLPAARGSEEPTWHFVAPCRTLTQESPPCPA